MLNTLNCYFKSDADLDNKFFLFTLAFKVRFYSGNFKCSKPGGHVCKHALSAQEDKSVKLNPREAATTFVLRRPGLNHHVNSVSFEVDGRRGTYLVKDGTKFIVATVDGTKLFGKSIFCSSRKKRGAKCQVSYRSQLWLVIISEFEQIK